MSSQGSAANLALAARLINLEWEKTKTFWRDQKSQEFEQNYLADLPAQVSAAVNALEEMDLLLKKIRSDCE